ncbi:hypothetical protein CVT24_009213 [Panaeolus cyanescens]|uniref:N-acetyltransferase domain-containing protein n=1 Tax=Panaeolus cyanescens TaxID=181874 RepID=A0A409Y943_9AGAR|nr:hypothetical protein CVT24_009213 [Panaeolus cyanescens]
MASRYIIRTLRKSDLAAVRDMVIKTFVYHEPAGRHLRFTEPEFYKLYDRFAPYINFNTSAVAEVVHEDSKARHLGVVSCHISVPLSAPVDLEDLSEPRLLLGVFDELHKPFEDALKKRMISHDRVLHSLIGATKAEYHGKGVYKKVLAHFSEQVERDARWDAAVAECTSPITRHLKITQLGWKEECFIRYEDYEVDGKRPFAGLKGGASLVWKEYNRGASR